MKLKPCPFCGNKSVDVRALLEYFPPSYQIYCSVCGCIGPLTPDDQDEKQAKARWNKRSKKGTK